MKTETKIMQPEVLLEDRVGVLAAQVDVVDQRVARSGEDPRNPRVGVADAPDGEGDARADGQAGLHHPREPERLRQRPAAVGRHLLLGVVDEGADVGLRDGDLQPEQALCPAHQFRRRGIVPETAYPGDPDGFEIFII